MKTKVRAVVAPNVTKDELSAEAVTILQNIESLIQELQSLGGGPSPDGPGQEAQMAAKEPEPNAGAEPDADDETQANDPTKTNDPTEDETKRMEGPPVNPNAAKALTTANPDASTGSGKADERVEDLPEPDEDNLDEITKAIARLLAKGTRVKKAVGPPPSQQDVMLHSILNSLLEVTKEVRGQGSVIADLLDGLGVTKQLGAPEKTKKPVATVDNGAVLKELVAALKKTGADNASDNGDGQAVTVRKNMNELVGALHQNAGSLWDPQ